MLPWQQCLPQQSQELLLTLVSLTMELLLPLVSLTSELGITSELL